MRDINRIDPLLEKLGEAWKKVPDQRFGQFMYNFFYSYGKDPFFAEDDEWMVGIQAYIDGKNIGKAMAEYHASKTGEVPKDLSDLLETAQHALRRAADEFKEEWNEFKEDIIEELNDIGKDDDDDDKDD
jgi:hypothetical protein